MKTNVLIISVGITVLLLALIFTGNIGGGKELRKLRQQIENDSALMQSITQEMQEISFTLDTVTKLDSDLRNINNINKLEALEKIRLINQLLADRQTQIADLEIKISELQFGQNQDIINGVYREKNERLTLSTEYYNDLYNQISNLQTDVVALKEIIKKKDAELLVKDQIINQIRLEREEQQKMLLEMEQKLILSQQEFEKATIKTAESYYNLAAEIRGIADKTNGLVNRQKKELMVNMAFEYFIKAHQMGHTDAKNQINTMLEDKEFSKHINDSVNELLKTI